MKLRKVCCGYRDINGNKIACPKKSEKRKNMKPRKNDTHGPCEQCFKESLLVIHQTHLNNAIRSIQAATAAFDAWKKSKWRGRRDAL